MNSSTPTSNRSRIYELDLLRPLTALTVVAVHTLGFTSGLYATVQGATTHYAVLDLIHWTRNVFLFITAFALTYVYYDRPFDTRRFWSKRSLGILVPYVFWSILYTWANNPVHQPVAFARSAFLDVVTGSASYQLYYILLTLQFYLVLPLFLRLLTYFARRPWLVLATSFLLELATMYVSYEYIQQGPLISSAVGPFLNSFQNRFLLTYQFYVVLGGLAAMYMRQSRAFLLRNGKWVALAFALSGALALANFYVFVKVDHVDLGMASAVLQPVMAVYSLGVILLLTWLACHWARRVGRYGQPAGYRFWRLLSDSAYGVYLVHAFILSAVLAWALPHMPAALPAGLRVLFVWVITATAACLFSMALVNIPVLSLLVGRSAPWQSPKGTTGLHQWLGNRFPRRGRVEANR